MSLARPKHRHSWIALAAFLGSLLVPGWASASCEATGDAGTCPPACCTAPGHVHPTPVEARTATAHLQSSSQDGCDCCSQAPAAPESKPEQQTNAEKPEPARDFAAGWIDFFAAPAIATSSVTTPAVSPQKLPIYLRNSRLLF